jgi:cytochrome c553
VLADDAPVIRSRIAREQGIRALTNAATAARVLLCVLLLADPADAAASDTAHHDDAQLVAGLPAEYIVAQMRAFASGARKSAWIRPTCPPS